jgi:hypothetical protein
MVRKDAACANNYWMDSGIFGEKREPTGPFDYGDGKTVGLHLKRNTYTFSGSDGNNCFGVYLGRHSDGYVVGIKSLDLNGFNACEVFDSIGDLHAEWRLD